MARSARLMSLVLLSVLSSVAAPAAALGQDPCQPAAVLAPSTEHQHVLVLAGRSGTFYDRSGPAFVMLVRMAGQERQVDAVGVYDGGGTPAFGQIPAALYREFATEPRLSSDVMLRLSISASQYDRLLKVLRTWERRARQGELLYPDVFMNNILFVKQVTEDLNRCEETVKLYALDWGVKDDISENNRPSNIPFEYFRELRRLNASRHLRDDQMPKAWLQVGMARR